MLKARVFIKTYGCTLNQSDSEAMAGILLSSGMKLAKDENSADVIVLNTCTVKGATEQKIMYEVRRLLKKRKKIVVAGCIPEADLALVRKNAPNSPIVGTRSLVHIAKAVDAAMKGRKFEAFEKKEEKLQLPRVRGSVIAKIPIAEGCLGGCTYCATKFARGQLHSFSGEEIACEVRECVKHGCKEIQLTAQDTGAYGTEKKTNLAKLLQQISSIPGNFRVRIGMMNPEHALQMLPELTSAFRSPKIYKFAHIPVQSGSNSVLKSMRRNYSVADFEKVVKAFRKSVPGIAISTDIIVGYPTETRKDFEATLRLMRKMKFDVVNISKFTPRPKTVAAKLKQLPNGEVKRRSEEAAALCSETSARNNRRLVGRKMELLVTSAGKARANNYKLAHITGAKEGEFVKAKITSASARCIKAELDK